MKKLFLIGLLISQAFTLNGYGKAVGYIEELKNRPPVYIRVPIREVAIPPVYDAKEISEYCKYELNNEGAQ